MKVLITGANGFIGKNLTSHLALRTDLQLLTYSRENTLEELKSYTLMADIIVHLAGVNRPSLLEEFESNNIKLAKTIIDTLLSHNKKTPVVFTSSTQASLDNPYGHNKKDIEELFYQFSSANNSYVGVYRLPNIFGKWSKPNYNSVVATWCHNISRGIEIEISSPDNKLTLSYIDDVVASFEEVIRNKHIYMTSKYEFIELTRTFTITLSELRDILFSFRNNSFLPSVDNVLIKFLHATYLSFLPKDEVMSNVIGKIDSRGSFFELLKSERGGQFSFSTTKPGVTRGNHFHHTKIEKFIVIKGEAVIKMRNTLDDTTYEFNVSGDSPSIVNMLPGYTHNITNTGTEDLLLVIWSNENYDPSKPDTYSKEV